jgi:hypothetical protein
VNLAARLRDGAGYAVLTGPFAGAALDRALAEAGDAIAGAGGDDVHEGSTSTRVNGVLGQAPALAALLDYSPLLEAVQAIVGGLFRLSSFHARSIRPGAGAQALHQDVAPGADGWPLAGFVLMLDAFTPQNGATRFLPGSHGLAALPPELLLRHPAEQQAHGEAGSLIVFDGSVWHGHAANRSAAWRRSIQGAFIPRSATPAIDFPAALPPAVWSGLSRSARAVLTGG